MLAQVAGKCNTNNHNKQNKRYYCVTVHSVHSNTIHHFIGSDAVQRDVPKSEIPKKFLYQKKNARKNDIPASLLSVFTHSRESYIFIVIRNWLILICNCLYFIIDISVQLTKLTCNKHTYHDIHIYVHQCTEHSGKPVNTDQHCNTVE